jgi:RNA polymerase sigma-70 factor (ECF subfamily)
MNLPGLLDGCLQKKPRACKQLYEQFYGYSLKIVFRYIYRYDKAVDVVNDGFVKIFTKLDKFHYDPAHNPEMIFMGWLKTIMIHTAIDRLRKDNFLPEIGMTNEPNWVEDRLQSPDQSVLYKDIINEVKKLPPGYRIVFNLFVIDGFSHQEIANKLKISVGTSKSNLSKAKSLLRGYIKTTEMPGSYATHK